MHALMASGTGRYADPWHPFPTTSRLIADVLRTAGFEVDIDDDPDSAMTRLDGVDLLVVNAGDPWRQGSPRLTPGSPGPEALTAALYRGIGVLAFHSALASLRDYPDWAPALGAMWVPGASWHPPLDTIRVTGGNLPDGNLSSQRRRWTPTAPMWRSRRGPRGGPAGHAWAGCRCSGL